MHEEHSEKAKSSGEITAPKLQQYGRSCRDGLGIGQARLELFYFSTAIANQRALYAGIKGEVLYGVMLLIFL